MKFRLHHFVSSLILVVSVIASSPAIGQASPANDAETFKNASRKLSVGIGVGIERFDTNFKFTNKSTGRSAFIDAEGTLGLPETDVVPILFGYWKPGKRHGLGFSYFRIDRKTTLLAIDENLGDLNVTGEVNLTDRTRFYSLTYNLTAFQDERSSVFASFGLYGLELRYQLDATGAINFQGNPVRSGEYSAEVKQIAPLPMVGIDAWFSFTPKWALGTKISFVAGKFGDISGTVLESTIRVRYAFNKNFGVTWGINYFDSAIDIDDDDLKTEINYGFDGLAMGIDVGF
jgi:hypothetical protein